MIKKQTKMRPNGLVAQPNEINKMKGSWMCPELTLPAVRSGADDHLEYPSRRGNTLYFKNGRTEKITP